MNNILGMSDEDLKCGVVAASAGNHSQAVAYAAKLKGVSAVVCVPESTPMNKRYGAIKHGARLVVYGPNYEDAENRAHEIEAEEGRKFVHAYESNETIAGQGTVAIESLLEKGISTRFWCPPGRRTAVRSCDCGQGHEPGHQGVRPSDQHLRSLG